MASIRLTHHFSTIGFIRIFNTSKLGQCTTIKNVTDVYCFFFEYSTISRAIRLDRKKSGFVYLLFLTFSEVSFMEVIKQLQALSQRLLFPILPFFCNLYHGRSFVNESPSLTVKYVVFIRLFKHFLFFEISVGSSSALLYLLIHIKKDLI